MGRAQWRNDAQGFPHGPSLFVPPSANLRASCISQRAQTLSCGLACLGLDSRPFQSRIRKCNHADVYWAARVFISVGYLYSVARACRTSPWGSCTRAFLLCSSWSLAAVVGLVQSAAFPPFRKTLEGPVVFLGPGHPRSAIGCLLTCSLRPRGRGPVSPGLGQIRCAVCARVRCAGTGYAIRRLSVPYAKATEEGGGEGGAVTSTLSGPCSTTRPAAERLSSRTSGTITS